MDRVLPGADALASRHPERTVFTRFVPPARPNEMPGMWQRYYTRWRVATRERLDFRLLDLMPPLAALCPLATVIDKTRYSAFAEPGLIEHLRQREADALIVSGSETDVCVLATVLDAVDIGYRVIVVRDAICSSSDEGHDAYAALSHPIFGADRDRRRRGNPRAVGMMQLGEIGPQYFGPGCRREGAKQLPSQAFVFLRGAACFLLAAANVRDSGLPWRG
jgi:nicotinamidase-related amidase